MFNNKMRIMSFLLIMTMVLSLFPVWGISSVVYAEDSVSEIIVPVTVRIEGNDRTIVPRMELEVTNIPLDDYGYPKVKYGNGPRTIHAIIKALEESGKDPKDKEVFYASWGGGFIETVDGISMGSGVDGWMYRIDDNFVSIGVNNSMPKHGSDIVLYYVEDFTKNKYSVFNIQELEVEKGDEFSLVLTSEKEPILGAQILVENRPFKVDGEEVTTDDNGEAVLRFDSEGIYHISAERFSDGVRDISRPYCKVIVKESAAKKEDVDTEKPADSGETTDMEEGPTNLENLTDSKEKPGEPKGSKLNETIGKTYSYYSSQKINLDSWWEIVALTAAGEDVTKSSWELPEWKSSDLEKDSSATYYPGYILGLMAQGKDPTNIWGRNLVAELRDKQEPNGRFDGINGHIWAIIALDAAKTDYDERGAIEHLITQQKNDGGYAWGEDNTPEASGDPDMTSMALVALANHRDIEGVEDTIQKALGYLKENQLPTGGFASWGNDNANSVASVVSGLVAVGEDVFSESWIKDDNTMLDALQRFMLEDGSFSFMLEPKESNGMATYQAFIALSDLKNQKSIWHTLSINPKKSDEKDIKEPPQKESKDQKESKEVEQLKEDETSRDKEKLKVADEKGKDTKQEEEKVKSSKTGDKGINCYILLAALSMSIAIYLVLNKKIVKQR